MNRKSKSIFEEINSFVPNRNKEELIEVKADHIISSAIHLIELIQEQYSEEDATQLERRFISSIKQRDSQRFVRTINKLKENKNGR